MCGECPPARLSHGTYVSTESDKPCQFVKNELNNTNHTTPAAKIPNATCDQGGSILCLTGDVMSSGLGRVTSIRHRFHQDVSNPAPTIAASDNTNASFVANISPTPTPVNTTQRPFRVRT